MIKGFVNELDHHFFIYHSWETSNFESTYKKQTFIKVAIFSDAILVSNHHSFKGEAINLIPHYLIDFIYKTVKSSRLETF